MTLDSFVRHEGNHPSLHGTKSKLFYEVGMAHTVGKPVVLITQNEPLLRRERPRTF
jgi:hypothetical protein